MSGDARRPPRVLISYSHDSSSHSEQVLWLAQDLRDRGIDAWIDQFEPFPEGGWPRWMQKQIELADFIMLICTATYRERYEGRAEPGKGRGVDWEGMLISQLVYEGHLNHRTLVPVLLNGASKADIPATVVGTFHQLPQDYDSLLNRLSGNCAETPRPLGQPRVYSTSRSRSHLEFSHLPVASTTAKQLSGDSQRYAVRIERTGTDLGHDEEERELMAVEPAYQETEDRLSLEFRTAFRRYRIARRRGVQTFIEVVATSAWHKASVDRPGIESCSAKAECNCTVTPILPSQNRAEWSCDQRQGHGFLEGNVSLQLSYRSSISAAFVSEARVTSIAFRNADGARIDTLAKIMALRVRLWAMGVDVPEPRRVCHKIAVYPTPDPPT